MAKVFCSSSNLAEKSYSLKQAIAYWLIACVLHLTRTNTTPLDSQSTERRN
jgi:hypothetical protein